MASHYGDVIMSTIASQITSLTIVYSAVYSDADQRKHQSSSSLAFVRGIHRGPVNSPHKWPVTRKMFPFDDVIMFLHRLTLIPLCVSSYIHYKMRDEITHPFPNFNEVREWISNFITHWTCDYLSMMGLKFIHVRERGTRGRCNAGNLYEIRLKTKSTNSSSSL